MTFISSMDEEPTEELSPQCSIGSSSFKDYITDHMWFKQLYEHWQKYVAAEGQHFDDIFF
jgi:hypothetical protein